LRSAFGEAARASRTSRVVSRSAIVYGFGSQTPNRRSNSAIGNRSDGRVILPILGATAAPDIAIRAGSVRVPELARSSRNAVDRYPVTGLPEMSFSNVKPVPARPRGTSRDRFAVAQTTRFGKGSVPRSTSEKRIGTAHSGCSCLTATESTGARRRPTKAVARRSR
jgi:hypothetical protein